MKQGYNDIFILSRSAIIYDWMVVVADGGRHASRRHRKQCENLRPCTSLQQNMQVKGQSHECTISFCTRDIHTHLNRRRRRRLRCRLGWCTRHALMARCGFLLVPVHVGVCCAWGMLAGRCRLLCVVFPVYCSSRCKRITHLNGATAPLRKASPAVFAMLFYL